MTLPVPLADVVLAIEPLNDEWQALINPDTGEIVTFTEEEKEEATAEGDDPDMPAWFADQAPRIREALASSAYIALPGRLDFHEYAVMEEFACSLSEPLRDELLHTMRGSGAFRRFKAFIREHDIDTQWFAWRDRALDAMAIDFLEMEGIPFIDRQGRERRGDA